MEYNTNLYKKMSKSEIKLFVIHENTFTRNNFFLAKLMQLINYFKFASI